MRHTASPSITRPRRALLAWVLAVVVTGLIAARAVAVLDTGTSQPGVMSPAEVDRALVAARAAATPTPTPTPVSIPSPTPAAVTTAPTPSASPTAGPPTSQPTGAVTPRPPAAVARTWSVTGGTVAASCTGSAISLLFATPADGWTVEVGGAGPQRIEVELKQPGSETKVVAVCSGGVPRQTIDESSGDRSSDR